MGRLFVLSFILVIALVLTYTITFIDWFIVALFSIISGSTAGFPISGMVELSRVYTGILLLIAPLLLIFFLLFLFIISRDIGPERTIRYDPIETPKIAVALTAYNDAKSIGIAVEDFKKQQNVIEVIAIDNNSIDDTALVARNSGARVAAERKQGYGYACIRGLQEALANQNANIIVLSEGDGTFHGSDIKKLTAFLDNADMIIGTRTTRELLEPDSQLDRFLIWGNLFLAKLIQLKYFDTKHFGTVRLTDIGPYRAIRRSALEKIIGSLSLGREHFAPHLIITAINGGLKVIEIPIVFSRRIGVSKGAGGNKWRAIKIGLSMVWLIISS
jgi:glycosyltransferase involved in cell wall biosynthesis